MSFQPRPDQQKVLSLLDTGGYLGVSAVPGSGKTAILSHLAARLVQENIHGEEEVLIVTVVNSAVDNFTRRIRGFLNQADRSLLPDVGYRVRTLHGLAHDILRERPALLGLPEDFDIIDERISTQILEDVAANWIKANPQMFNSLVTQTLDENQRKRQAREKWPKLVTDIARSFIRRAKDYQLTPAALREQLPHFTDAWAIGSMCLEIYDRLRTRAALSRRPRLRRSHPARPNRAANRSTSARSAAHPLAIYSGRRSAGFQLHAGKNPTLTNRER